MSGDSNLTTKCETHTSLRLFHIGHTKFSNDQSLGSVPVMSWPSEDEKRQLTGSPGGLSLRCSIDHCWGHSAQTPQLVVPVQLSPWFQDSSHPWVCPAPILMLCLEVISCPSHEGLPVMSRQEVNLIFNSSSIIGKPCVLHSRPDYKWGWEGCGPSDPWEEDEIIFVHICVLVCGHARGVFLSRSGKAHE